MKIQNTSGENFKTFQIELKKKKFNYFCLKCDDKSLISIDYFINKTELKNKKEYTFFEAEKDDCLSVIINEDGKIVISNLFQIIKQIKIADTEKFNGFLVIAIKKGSVTFYNI